MGRHWGRTTREQPAALRPGYLALLAGVLGLALAIFAWYEVREARRIVRSAMEEGAASLVEAVARAGENALRADAEMEALVVERLLDNARAIRLLEGTLSAAALERLALQNGLHQAALLAPDGRCLLSSSPWEAHDADLAARLEQVWRGDREMRVVFGQNDRWVAAAVRHAQGGAVLVAADAAQLLELRRAAGFGRLVRELGANPGVAYVVLQDPAGILAASEGVEELGRIAGDVFLEEALGAGRARSRLTEQAGQEIFETAMGFALADGDSSLLRIGLSATALEAEEGRVRRRLGLLAGLLVVLGAAGVGLVTVRQNNVLLREAYDWIQTYSARILANMADAVVATDPRGRIRVFNRAAERVFQLSSPQAVGRTCTEILGGGVSALEETLQTGEEVQGQTCRYRIRQGPEVTLSISTSLIRDSRGELETAVAVIQDLTEHRALEEEVRRRERLAAMGQLAAGVAHEVRNPLNAIGLIVQRLEREFEPQADRDEYLGLVRTVRGEVARVNRIVQQFLEYSRPPALDLQEADLEGILDEALQVAAARAGTRGVALERRFGGVGPVRLDPEQVKQAVLNLLDNAVEATEEGHVEVATRLLDGWVAVEVRDTGRGIAPEHRERVFDLYFTTRPNGTGLGLSLVHRIVAEHGGRVEVRSQVGEGTVFTVLLPRRE
ncbi:MAG: ATP-binding protein [Candidatus Latescibacterota bacterium]